MFMMVRSVFWFTFSCVFNRQCIHNLFKNQMIRIKFNRAMQLKVNLSNSLLQCSLGTCLLSLAPPWTCFHFCNAPLRPGFHLHPHGTCFHFCNAPLRPGFHPHPHGTWLSLFQCFLTGTRHGERIGYLCPRRGRLVFS